MNVSALEKKQTATRMENGFQKYTKIICKNNKT